MINLLPREGLADVVNEVVVWAGVVFWSGVEVGSGVVSVASVAEMSLVTTAVLIKEVEIGVGVEDYATKWKIKSGYKIGAYF